MEAQVLDNTERNGSSSDAVSPSEFPIGSDESRMAARAALQRIGAVSYTHLDVYKRQGLFFAGRQRIIQKL